MSELEHDYFENDNNLQPLDSIEDSSQDGDILNLIRKNISRVDIRSPIFYTLQQIEMVLLSLISTASIIPLKSIENYPQIQTFQSILKFLLISPSLFVNQYLLNAFFISIFAVFIVFIGYFFFSLYSASKANQPNSTSFTIWIIFHRLFLPIPGIFIGHTAGHYLIQLTKEYNTIPLMTSVLIGFVWVWTIYSANYFHNQPYQRKYDYCQINHNYFLFDTYVLICPLIQSFLPSVLTIFCHENSPLTYCFLTSFLSILTILYVIYNKPYNFSNMNKLIIFLSLSKIPVGSLWIIQESYPQQFVNAILCILLIIITLYLLVIVIPCLCITCNQHNDPNNPNLAIALKAIEMKRRDSFSIPDFDPTQNCPMPFYLLVLQPQDIFLVALLLFAALEMLTLNVFASYSMTISEPLPDIIHQNFPIAKAIRTSSVGAFQLSNLIAVIQLGAAFIVEFVAPDYLNVRRIVVLWSSLAILRSFAFMSTGLPAPCSGYPNCPCADPTTIENIRSKTLLEVASNWLFSFGLYPAIPQCGDLIISGHTMWIWLSARTCCSSINHIIRKPFNYFISGFIYTLAFLSLGYITMSRNHYTIDVIFGYLFPELFWIIYNLFQAKAMKPAKPSDSTLVKIVRWIERRPPYRQIIQNKKLMGELE